MATRRGGIAVLWDFLHGVRKGASSALSQLAAPTGEAGFARLVGYRGPYSGANTQPWARAEQIRNYRHWVYRCVRYLGEQAVKVPPRVAYVTEPGAAKVYDDRTKAARWGQGKAPDPRQFLPDATRRGTSTLKAYFGALSPHEDFEYADPGDRLGELLRNPNGPDTWVQFWYSGVIFDQLCGVNYTWVVDGPDGKPESLWQVPAHWVVPVCLGREKLVDYYEVKPWGGSGQVLTRFSEDELIECKQYDPWNPLGASSPLQQCSETVDQYQQIQGFRYHSSLNRMSAETVIEFTGAGSEPVSEELLSRLESQIAGKYQGVANALRPVILPPGLSINRNPSDMELAYLQSTDQIRDYVISQVFGLPRAVLGIGEGVPWATVVAQIRQVYADVLGPLLSRWGATYTEKLARRFAPGARIFWELPRPQDDAQKLAEWAGTPGPAVTLNEYRTEILGLEPLDGEQYDQPMQPAGMLPGGGGDDDLAGLFDRGPNENTGGDEDGDGGDGGDGGDAGDPAGAVADLFGKGAGRDRPGFPAVTKCGACSGDCGPCLDGWAEKAGFTGRRTDSAGRARCYANGKPVPCGGAGGAETGRPHLDGARKVLSDPASATPADVAALKNHLRNLTGPELAAVGKEFQARFGGRVKAARVSGLVEWAKAQGAGREGEFQYPAGFDRPSTRNGPNPALPAAARPKLDAAEAKAAAGYSATDYQEINTGLRAGKELSAPLRASVDRLRGAIARAPEFPAPVPVKRGFVLGPTAFKRFSAAVAEAEKTGAVAKIPGFVSCSADPPGESSDFNGNVKLKIRAVKGLDMKPYSMEPSENELLMDHESRFRVRKVVKDKGRLTVELDQLPSGAGGEAGVSLTGVKPKPPKKAAPESDPGKFVGGDEEGEAWAAAFGGAADAD